MSIRVTCITHALISQGLVKLISSFKFPGIMTYRPLIDRVSERLFKNIPVMNW